MFPACDEAVCRCPAAFLCGCACHCAALFNPTPFRSLSLSRSSAPAPSSRRQITPARRLPWPGRHQHRAGLCQPRGPAHLLLRHAVPRRRQRSRAPDHHVRGGAGQAASLPSRRPIPFTTAPPLPPHTQAPDARGRRRATAAAAARGCRLRGHGHPRKRRKGGSCGGGKTRKGLCRRRAWPRRHGASPDWRHRAWPRRNRAWPRRHRVWPRRQRTCPHQASPHLTPHRAPLPGHCHAPPTGTAAGARHPATDPAVRCVALRHSLVMCGCALHPHRVLASAPPRLTRLCPSCPRRAGENVVVAESGAVYGTVD